MYRFDDKTRRRLLEDALVADLLAGKSGKDSKGRDGSAGNVPDSKVAAAPAKQAAVLQRTGPLAPALPRWFSTRG